jgi:hypothetical protein
MNDNASYKRQKTNRQEKEKIDVAESTYSGEDSDVDECEEEFNNKRRFFALTTGTRVFFSDMGYELVSYKEFEGRPHILVGIKKNQILYCATIIYFSGSANVYTDFMDSMKFCHSIKEARNANYKGLYILLDRAVEEILPSDLGLLSNLFKIQNIHVV